MTISFNNLNISQLKEAILNIENRIKELHVGLGALRRMEKDSIEVCKKISFGINPNYEDVYKSIAAFIGTYTIESMDAKIELEKKLKEALP